MSNETDGHDDKTVLINKQQGNLHDPQTQTKVEEQSQQQAPLSDETVLQSTEVSSTTSHSDLSIPYEQSLLEQNLTDTNLNQSFVNREPTEDTMINDGGDPSDTSNATRILHPSLDQKSTDGPSSLSETAERASATINQNETSTPVVGWLVVIEGPGRGDFRPIFYGNNTVGRSPSQRIALNFGDDAISSEEQAYIQYNYKKREFLFIPNLAKPNILEVNEDNPSGPIPLNSYDKIRIGETTLIFISLCGDRFEWSELDTET